MKGEFNAWIDDDADIMSMAKTIEDMADNFAKIY